MSSKLPDKAGVLQCLKTNSQNIVIDDLFVFTVADWQSGQERILVQIICSFPTTQPLIVRSSAFGEDHFEHSWAGFYHSEPEVKNDFNDLTRSINKVIASYCRQGRSLNPYDRIIIQKQVQQTKISGVVFTRDPKTNSPYYVINYDAQNGRTDIITRGWSGKSLRVFRDREIIKELISPWSDLLSGIQEVEAIFQQELLDIEFAIDSEGKVHIFQARSLKNDGSYYCVNNDLVVANTIRQSIIDFNNAKINSYNLPGTYTIFTDMSDWNPAEILGGRPNLLDSSLYRFLVTQSVWNEARVSMGYTNVSPSELMVIVANKPYIDTRVSFNSLTPAGLPCDFQERLIDYYLYRLENNPQLQDKVEFDILFTCFDLTFDDRAFLLLESGFSKQETAYLKQHLLSFTNVLLQRAETIFNDDLNAVRQLGNLLGITNSSDPSLMLNQAYQLLTTCQKLGTFPFARLARLAFIGLTLLKGLVKQEVIDVLFYDDFLNSLETVTKQMTQDFYHFAQGVLPLESFIDKYGHLRPGTYNILALRYRDTSGLFDGLAINQIGALKTNFVLDQTILQRIDLVLANYGLECSAQFLFSFVKRAIEYREYSKFEFTKILSDAIELIAMAGEYLGFSREEIALLDLDTIMVARESPPDMVRSMWKEVIAENRERKARFSQIALPPVLTFVQDLWVVPYYESYPNFITRKRIEGIPCVIGHAWYEGIPDVSNKIVLIESADPGYDWIFTQHPKGLITKYGGVASHMAIRCAELGLPAAIGCGETIFNCLSASSKILLDCSIETIVPA